MSREKSLNGAWKKYRKKEAHRKRLNSWLPGLIGVLLIVALFPTCPIITKVMGHNTNGEFQQVTVERVVDGDTLFVRTSTGQENYVRLIGVDTPESVNPDESKNTPEGRAASDFVKSLIEPETKVYLMKDTSNTDSYERWLRYVWLSVPGDSTDPDQIRTQMLQGILLSAGYAEPMEIAPDLKYAEVFRKIAA